MTDFLLSPWRQTFTDLLIFRNLPICDVRPLLVVRRNAYAYERMFYHLIQDPSVNTSQLSSPYFTAPKTPLKEILMDFFYGCTMWETLYEVECCDNDLLDPSCLESDLLVNCRGFTHCELGRCLKNLRALIEDIDAACAWMTPIAILCHLNDEKIDTCEEQKSDWKVLTNL